VHGEKRTWSTFWKIHVGPIPTAPIWETRTINADDIKLDGNMEHHWKLDWSNNWLLYHNWWFSNKLERLSFFPSFLGGEYPMITGPRGWWGLGCDKWRWTQKKSQTVADSLWVTTLHNCCGLANLKIDQLHVLSIQWDNSIFYFFLLVILARFYVIRAELCRSVLQCVAVCCCSGFIWAQSARITCIVSK